MYAVFPGAFKYLLWSWKYQITLAMPLCLRTLFASQEHISILDCATQQCFSYYSSLNYIKGWIKQRWYIHTQQILFSCNKECSSVMGGNMDDPERHYVNWNQLGTDLVLTYGSLKVLCHRDGIGMKASKIWGKSEWKTMHHESKGVVSSGGSL